MRVSLIVAMAEGGVIGRDNDLPWRLSADLKRFKRITMGHHLLMGRRTYDSIGRPLPGRTSVVISRGRPRVPPGVRVASSIDEALEIARSAGEDEAFVIGGAEIFRQTIDRVDRVYLTRVEGRVEGDTFFDEFDEANWVLVASERHEADDRNSHPVEFRTLERRSTG